MTTTAAAIVLDGKVRGSAVRVSADTYLTASWTVVRDGGSEALLRPVNTVLGIPFEVVWTCEPDDAVPIAVLRITGDNTTGTDALPLARFVGGGTRQCTAVGFFRGEAVRIAGPADPESYPESGLIQFTPAHSVADRIRGFGGSGLEHDGHLVGVITSYDREGWFLVTPAAAIVDRLASADALGPRFREEYPVTDLEPPDVMLSTALADLARADPANIQQVAATQLALTNLYYENVLSQAKRSFNAATAAAITGLAFFLAAITFALTTDQTAAPLVSTLGGGIVEVVAGLNFWLYGRTSVQLNAFHARLERMQRFLVANSVASSLEGELKGTTVADLVKAIAAVEPEQEAQ